MGRCRRQRQQQPPGGQQKSKTNTAPQPRQRRSKVKKEKDSYKILFWIRDGGRLVKLERPAEVINDDIIMMDIQHVQSVFSKYDLVDNQRFPDENGCNTNFVPENERISLLNLPNELLENIILFLDVDSVARLGQVNQKLHDFVETNYYVHLMIPCEQALMDKLVKSKRKILRLTSNCTLRNLHDPLTGEFQVTELNMTALKVLQLYGNNYSWYNSGSIPSLTKLYSSCLEYILSTVNPISFTSLGFILDHNVEIWTSRIKPLLSKLTSLETLTLYGHSRGVPHPGHVLGDNNTIINSLLSASYAKNVVIKRFMQREGKPMVINNPHIVSLEVDFGKTGSLRLKNMNSLVKLKVAEMYFTCNCLRHYSDGELYTDLVKEAPSLRYYNEIDLKIIEEKYEEKSGLENICWFDCPLVQDIQLFHDFSKELGLRQYINLDKVKDAQLLYDLGKELGRKFQGYDY